MSDEQADKGLLCSELISAGRADLAGLRSRSHARKFEPMPGSS